MGLLDDVIDEVDGVGLGMFLVDLERSDAGCLVDGGILEASELLTLLSDESQELGAHLDRRPGTCFIVLCVDFADTGPGSRLRLWRLRMR